MSSKIKIGFVGLGNMGSGMASNLLKFTQAHGHDLLVLDLNQSAVDSLVTLGAIDGESIANIAQQVDVLFTSLPSAKEITEVALGNAGLLQNLKANSIWFETSTNELSEWQKILADAPESLCLVDAPVTGGAEGAAAGTLTMLLGIDQQVLKSHAQILASFTAKAVRLGPSGSGYVAKLCQLHLNYLVAQGIGETMMLGAKANIDLQTLYGVLQSSCAQSYVVDSYIPKVLDGSYDESFTLGLATKDMRLISELGEHLDVPLSLADSVYASYQKAATTYGADEPHLKIVKLIEDQAGQLLRS